MTALFCSAALVPQQTSEQLPHPKPGDRIAEIGCHFGHRAKYEKAFTEAWMRHLKARLVDHFVAEDQQVQIERPRRARVRALTTALAFDLEQQIDQTAGVQGGVADEDRIQIVRLIRRVWYALRFGLNEIRQRER